jgi:hypothetical protein
MIGPQGRSSMGLESAAGPDVPVADEPGFRKVGVVWVGGAAARRGSRRRCRAGSA